MSAYREPFSQLNQRDLELLIKKTHLYALKILGNRQGQSPVIDAEDLMMRALEDTMIGAERAGNGAEAKGRRWDSTARSLWAHLRGCIRSYISHYGKSSEGIRRVDIKSQPRTIFNDQDLDGEGMDVSDLLTDEITPEDELESEETNRAIDRRVREEGEPTIIILWELVLKNKFDLKHDRLELCERLGLDPTVGGSDYQRFNRYRNRLKELVELGYQDCLAPV